MKGKRTYAALAGVVVTVAVGYAARHGIDLGPLRGELVDAVIILLAGAAAYFRSQAQK